MLIPMVYVSHLCDLPFLRYSQFKYPFFDNAMAPRSDDVLEMSENSERELTVLSSIVFRRKDKTSSPATLHIFVLWLFVGWARIAFLSK